MHKPESILENENPKVLWDLEIKTNHLILIRHQTVEVKKEKNLPIIGFCCSDEPLVL